MKIGRFYLNTKDNGLYHEVNVYEDMTIKVFTRTFKEHLIHLIKGFTTLIFSKKTTNQNYQKDLSLKSFDIITAQNHKRIKNGLKPLSEKKIVNGIVNANIKVKAKKQINKKLNEKKLQKQEYEKKPNYIG